MRTIALMILFTLVSAGVHARTLIAYYSYTNNVSRIVSELQTQIDADVVRIEPAEKGLDYAANNYAVGSAQISAIRNNPDDASSYPEIDPVDIDFDRYETVIVAAPLWWSNMAAPMQSFLFSCGRHMAGKNIGLIVSSASSGISGVEADARRLIPDGKFLTPSLWIRSSQTANAKTMLSDWLRAIGYDNFASIGDAVRDVENRYTIYSLSGALIADDVPSTEGIEAGIYIVNGNKTLILR